MLRQDSAYPKPGPAAVSVTDSERERERARCLPCMLPEEAMNHVHCLSGTALGLVDAGNTVHHDVFTAQWVNSGSLGGRGTEVGCGDGEGGGGTKCLGSSKRSKSDVIINKQTR